MNRFAIDEDPGYEISKVLEFEKASWKLCHSEHPEYKDLKNERKQKGMDFKLKFSMQGRSRSAILANFFKNLTRLADLLF